MTTDFATSPPMRIGYCRVSTDAQTTDLQRDALKAAGCVRIFQDKASALKHSRPGLDSALSAIGAGDVLVVWKFDRVARSVEHLLSVLKQLRNRGATFHSITEGVDTDTPIGECFFTILAALAALERSILIERTRAGLAAARSRGRKLGRRSKLTSSQAKDALACLASGVPAKAVAAEYGVCRATLYRYRQREGS